MSIMNHIYLNRFACYQKLDRLWVIGSIFLTLAPTIVWAQPSNNPPSATSNPAPASAAPPAPTPALPPWPDLKVPNTQSVEGVNPVHRSNQTTATDNPRSLSRHANAIREAAQRILKLTRDRSSSVFQSAEFDYFSSSVMLLGNEGPDASARFTSSIEIICEPSPSPTRMICEWSCLRGKISNRSPMEN